MTGIQTFFEMILTVLRLGLFPFFLFLCAREDRQSGCVRVGRLLLLAALSLAGLLLSLLLSGEGGFLKLAAVFFMTAPGAFLVLIAAMSGQRAAGMADGIVLILIGFLYGMDVYLCFLIADLLVMVRMLLARKKECPMIPDLFYALLMTEGIELVIRFKA